MGPEFACAGVKPTTTRMAAKPRARLAKSVAGSRKTGHQAAVHRNAHRARAHHAARGRKVARRAKAPAGAGWRSLGGSVGLASYYAHGVRTASGARFNPSGMTAAHRTLPFGTRVLVTHLASGRSVTVTINDRGPFVKGRIIDLSRGAASALGITKAGVARVEISVIGRG
jgi:rare lipoprotein A